MPRFFFHLQDGTDWLHDQEGKVLPSVGAAMIRALQEARALVAADIIAGKPVRLGSHINLDDERGETVGTVMLRNAIIFDDTR